MGRGNACVHGEYEGLFYVDWGNFSDQYENETGDIVTDYDMQRDAWGHSLAQFVSDISTRFKSFRECDEWVSRYEHAVMENSLFYIVVEDNEWSIAIKLIQKDSSYLNIVGLQARLHKFYLSGMKDCLFNQFEELGTYAGAWTSGTIKRPA